MHVTPVTLLERLRRPNEQAAWERFVHLYTPLLSLWAHRLGLHGPDADDLLQDVFSLLVRKLPEFRYDPKQRFRGWLWTITLNKARDRLRRRPADAVLADNDVLDRLPSGEDPGEALDEEEYRSYLVGRALDLMQAEFQPTTWKAFWESTAAERPAADVAAELGISVGAVYTAKSRVLRRLRQELQGLLE
jgi:RNA polymerase sigma-70 factor (ECF subfamily)